MFLLKRAYYTQVLFDILVNYWGRVSEIFSPLFFLPPLVLRLRITNRCNLNCHFCYVGESLNKKSPETLLISEWAQIIKNIPRHTLVDITGGEPFLAPGFPEIINMLLEKKCKIALITNGTVSKFELLENMVAKKLNYFMVSIDGSQPIHDQIRGQGSFDKTIETLKQVIDLKKKYNSSLPTVVCKISLTEDNHDSLLQLSSFLMNDLSIDGITLNLLFNNEARNGKPDTTDFYDAKFWSGNTMKYKPESASAIARTAREIMDIYKQKVSIKPKTARADILAYLLNPSSFAPASCHKYRSVTTLYFDGKLTPCDLGLDVGNIREINYNIKKLSAIKNLKKFYGLIRSHERKIPGCAGCCLKTQVAINEN